ncbi:AAA family ATPase [uncultured Flavobacterium sp.]|uniref:AAA family ATPase n=1 Tax=uncultured Flavobacterium sp. TaxID=165435 RepID=UPI0030820286
MKIKLQNIGIIEEADINIEGITLIAGQNDSGKSTIGKVLYALVRGVNIDEQLFNSSKNEYIRNKIRDIRNLLLRTKPSNPKDDDIQKEFISEYIDNIGSHIGEFIVNIYSNKSDSNDLIKELDAIDNLYSNFSNQSIKLQLSTFINDITNRISISIDSKEVLHYELEAYFQNEFGSQIQNKFKKDNSAISIEGAVEQKIIFEEPITFEGFESSSSFYYNDVFFIESPMKLGNKNSIRFTNVHVLRDKNEYLNSKILQQKKDQDIFSDTTENTEKLNSIISDVIKGKFGFNSKNQLIFQKEDIEFDLNNVATGIKSFGVLQLLLQKGVLNSNSLLIIDEPEVHLHPTWQVKYAEILVRLSQEFAIPIVLTSHSPYFIEALEAYCKKYQYEDLTNFYFAEKNEDGLSSKIIDVTKDITPILSSISDAFYKIQDINNED